MNDENKEKCVSENILIELRNRFFDLEEMTHKFNVIVELHTINFVDLDIELVEGSDFECLVSKQQINEAINFHKNKLLAIDQEVEKVAADHNCSAADIWGLINK